MDPISQNQQAGTFSVQLPNGQVLDNVPAGTTKSQIKAKLEKAGINLDGEPLPPSLAERVGGGIMGFNQGTSYGFGDELQAGLTAAGTSVLDALQFDRLMGGEYEKSFQETYQDDLTKTRERMDKAAEQTPVEYYGGQVAGGIATAPVLGATAPGQVVTKAVTQGLLPSRIISSGAAGALSGATYGFGTGEGGFDERIESAQQGGIYGGIGGAAVPAAGAAIKSASQGVRNMVTGAKARGVEQLDEALAAIRQQASQSYKKMRDVGAVIKKDEVKNIAATLDNAMSEAGPAIKELHRPTLAILDSIKKAAKKGNMGLGEVDKYRSVLGRIAANKMDGENSYRATKLLQALDDSLDDLGESAFLAGDRSALKALKQGRREFSRAKKFETVATIIKKSDGDANYLKRELKKLLDNPKKLRGFNQNEISALKEASSLSFGEGSMKMLGKFGFDLGSSRIGNTALPVVGAGASYAAGSGGLAAVVPTAGTAARYGQKALARGKAEKLLQAIESGTSTAPARTAFHNPSVGGAAVRPASNANTAPSILKGFMRDESGSVNSQVPMAAGLGVAGAIASPNKTEANVFDDFDAYQQRDMPAPIPQNIPDQSVLEPQKPQNNLLDKIAFAESSGNPNAKSKTSSASGLFQFTNGTWRSMVKKYGGQTGIKVKDKNDPNAQRTMAELLIQENSDILSKKINRAPNDGELYIAHFMGPARAAKLIKAIPENPPAIRLVPRGVSQANKSIFFDGKRPRRASEVYELLTAKVS